ncbi:kinase-like domain-containing protein [Chytriomyces cf. hyalinus JEL632]|nr:kinase-like domain-containing protein [Chytriomyces cf. hyalinus JEL632]
MGADQSLPRRKPLPIEINVDLRSFNLLRVVGKGAFGKVRIVEKKDSGVLYALKYINKLQCIRMRAIQNIFRERCILEDINHPLIVNLRYAFQDDYHMFMVLDLMEGGDLRFHLDKVGGFTEPVIRTWAAEIVYGIHYLHSKNVLHRDLKPDNVLLDAAGHAHLTDFNIAVNFSDKRMLKSHSGTLAYMAPDILADKGYLWQIDWWSVGVILYELYYGKRPFRGTSNTELGRAIKSGQFVFHTHNMVTKQTVNISPDFRAFLSGLMTVNRDLRLGCGPGGSSEVMNHPFFRGIDWNAVAEKRLQPQYVPDSAKANFDATLEVDEQKQDDEYLQYRPKLRQNKTALANELKAAAAAASIPPNFPTPAPTTARHNGSPSLAKFLNATPLAQQPAPSSLPVIPPRLSTGDSPATPNKAGSNPKILEVTQLLGLQQIRESVENNAKDPKAPNKERIEAELDFIDENYDPFDWEVAQRVAALQAYEESGGFEYREPGSRQDRVRAGSFDFGDRMRLGGLPRMRSLGRPKADVGEANKLPARGATLDRMPEPAKSESNLTNAQAGSGGGQVVGKFLSMGRSKSIGALNRAFQSHGEKSPTPLQGAAQPRPFERSRTSSSKKGDGTVPRASPLVPRRRE